MAAKNPSSVIFWNDLENDEHLKTCSLAAKGLWDHHMLPIAARSVEPGVIVLGNHPSRLADDLPLLLARAVGEVPDVITILLRELVDSGAASVDDAGRVYNRRMVREEAIRRARSASGKRGADVTNEKRQKSGKHPGKDDGNSGGDTNGNDVGKEVGKTTAAEVDLSQGVATEISDDPSADVRQNVVEPVGASIVESGDAPADETAHSSLLHASLSNEVTTASSLSDSARENEFEPAGNGAHAEDDLAIPPFLKRSAGRAQPIAPDWIPSESAQAELVKSRPDLTPERIVERTEEFRLWCAETNKTSHNPDATWLGFMRRTHEQRSRNPSRVQRSGEAAQPDGISAAFARRSVLAGG